MEFNFTDLLAGALQRAASAHEAYQQANGIEVSWPEWYAEHMTGGLAEDRERLQGVLLDALHAAHAAHTIFEANELGGVYDEVWPDWYAEYMTGRLGADAPKLLPGLTAFALV
jgi:hypothetical protein